MNIVVHCVTLMFFFSYCSSKKPHTIPRLLSSRRFLLKPEFFVNCKDATDVTARVIRVEFIRQESTSVFVLNANFSNDEVIPKFSEIIVRIDRCDDATRVTCQNYQTWRFKQDICAFIQSKGLPWSPLVLRVSPTLKCPIQVGIFSMQNGTIDMDALTRLPFVDIEKYFWRVRVETFYQKRLMCIDAGYRVFPSRSKRNTWYRQSNPRPPIH